MIAPSHSGIEQLVSLVACIIVTEARQPWAFFGTPLRAWEFGVGALVYILPRHQRLETDLWYRSISWIGMALVVLSGLLLVEGDAFPGALAIPAVIGTGLMLRASGFDSGTVGRFLSIGPMQFLGRLSYSWYLWHWPVLTLADSLQPGPLALGPSLLCLAISLALSAVTFVLVEDPIRRHRALVPRSLATIGLGAVLISVGAGTSYGSYSWAKRALDSPSQRAITFARQYVPGFRECVAKYADTEPIVCEFGPSTGRETLVLFGDSHAHQWLPAFQRLASENDLKLLTFLKSACPTAMTPAFYYPALKRAYHECVTWCDLVLEQIVETNPVAVVLTNSLGYVRGVPDRGYGTLSYEEWGRAHERTFRKLEQRGIQAFLIRDNPRPGFDIPTCLSKAAWQDDAIGGACDLQREDVLDAEVFQAEKKAAEPFASIRIVDLTPHHCDDATCAATIDGQIVYRDTNHLTTSYVLSLYDRVRTEILGPGLGMPSPTRPASDPR